MRRITLAVFVLALCAVPLYAARRVTEANLPSSCQTARIYVVTNADTVQDCDPGGAGGGAVEAICMCNSAGTEYIELEAAASFTDLDTDYGDETITSDFDFGGGTLQVPNSTSLPATCEVGDSYMDTNATSGQRWFLCESADTWALQGDGGAGGAPTDADYLVGTANLSLSAEIVAGTSPQGELGGTWGSPTVDATHSGSAHHAADGVGYDEVLEEASGLTKRLQINFIGASATCVDNAGATRTDCTFTDADTIFSPNAAPGVDHSSYVAGHGDGANCSAGSYPLGVDAAGAAESCTDASTETDSIVATHAGIATAHHTATTDTGPSPDCVGTDQYQDGEGGCDTVGGDLSGGLDVAAVGDDSHAHTTTTLSGIAVTDLANGTDGELITWSAAGVAETVAVGTATHVLTSNGVGTAPTFQAAAGGGLSNVVEDTTPQLGGQLDVNGNALGDGTLELLAFVETASAINEVTITNAALGGNPTVMATGDDTDISMQLGGKGTGQVLLGGCIDADLDGNCEVSHAGSTVSFDMDDSGSVDATFVDGTGLSLSVSNGNNLIRNKDDGNTGVIYVSADKIGLEAGGDVVLQVIETSTLNTVDTTANANNELVIPNGAAPLAVCTVGAIFLDTDETDDTNCTTAADNSYCLCTATNTWTALESGGAGGTGAFSDAGDPVVLNTTTKDVHVGDGAGTLAGKLEIGGDADQPQLVIEGHSTQTDSLLVAQNDADAEVATIDVSGLLTTLVGLDAIGAVGLNYGSVDVTDHTFVTDSTGTAEFVVPAGSIDSTEILDATIAIGDLAAGTDGELITWDASGNAAVVAVGTVTHVLTSNGVGVAPTFQAAAGGGGSLPDREIVWPAAALDLSAAPDDSFPSPAEDEGTNIDVQVLGYDDTTDECAGGVFIAPSDIDGSGTVTFRLVWYSGTATTGDAMWDFRHVPIADDQSWDQALTIEESGAVGTAGTTDLLTITTWTETVSNMAWGASEVIEFLVCRDADSTGTGTDDLVGDAQLLTFSVEIPRA